MYCWTEVCPCVMDSSAQEIIAYFDYSGHFGYLDPDNLLSLSQLLINYSPPPFLNPPLSKLNKLVKTICGANKLE